MELETADFSQLLGAGFKFPVPFTAKADDGVTDLFGVMYKPYDFDPAKTYPIVACKHIVYTCRRLIDLYTQQAQPTHPHRD